VANRTKHPDLADLAPAKQLKQMPPLPEGKCGKRNKSCSIHGGGCGHRFKKGDKSWLCPNCAADRRCWSNRVKSSKSCRMHGAGGSNGGRPPSQEYAIIQNLYPQYNQILSSPELLNNTQDIAALRAIGLDLFEKMEKYDTGASMDDLQKAIATIGGAIHYGNTGRLRAGVDLALSAIAPVAAAEKTRKEYYDILNLVNRMRDSQRKWALENKEMVPFIQVLELLDIFSQQMFKYLPDASHRSAFVKEFKDRFGSVARTNGNAS